MRKNGNAHPFLSSLAIILLILSYNLFLGPLSVQSASTGVITATIVVGVCGDNVVTYGEDCDGSALDGQTCQSLGYDAGTLSCDMSCSFDESECVNLGPGEGSVVLSGLAYPDSVVKILKDGQIAATTAADSNGNFETSLSNLTVGSYSFSVYAYDSSDDKSKTLTYRRDVSKDEIEEISGIIIPPTLRVDDDRVKQGKKITFSGQAPPSSSVKIRLKSDNDSETISTSSGRTGYFSSKFDTSSLKAGEYSAKADVEIEGSGTSEDSESIDFKITEKDEASSSSTSTASSATASTAAAGPASGTTVLQVHHDLNDDNKVNLIDYSIFLYDYERETYSRSSDLNADGKVSLSDFSIMMYFWTG